MGWLGPLAVGLGTGFLNAASNKSQQDAQRAHEEKQQMLDFYQHAITLPGFNPDYLPAVMSGIADLHNAKPKDKAAIKSITDHMSSLLQGGKGAPTQQYDIQGYQPTQQSSGMPATPTQPTQGGMIAMPPMPQMGSMPQQMNVQPAATTLNAGPGMANGVSLPMNIEGVNGPLGRGDGGQPFRLPPMPQLMTANGPPTANQSITKAEPAFINPFQAKANAALPGIEARGEQARLTLGQKQAGELTRDQKKYAAIFKGKTELETQHNTDLVNRELDRRKVIFNGDEDAAQQSLQQDYQNHVANTLAKTSALEDEGRKVDAYVDNINSEIETRRVAGINAGKTLQLKSDTTGYQGELKKLQGDYKGISTELNALYGNPATFLSPDSKAKVAELEVKKAAALQKLSELKPPVVATSIPAGKQTLTPKGGHAARKPGQAASQSQKIFPASRLQEYANARHGGDLKAAQREIEGNGYIVK